MVLHNFFYGNAQAAYILSPHRIVYLALVAAAVGALHALKHLVSVALVLLGQDAVHIGLEALAALGAQGVHLLFLAFVVRGAVLGKKELLGFGLRPLRQPTLGQDVRGSISWRIDGLLTA